MPVRFKTFFIVLVLIFLFESSLGLVGSSEDATYPAVQVTKVRTRKAASIEFALEYDYGGPNPRHDPRKGKPGRGL